MTGTWWELANGAGFLLLLGVLVYCWAERRSTRRPGRGVSVAVIAAVALSIPDDIITGDTGWLVLRVATIALIAGALIATRPRAT